MSAGESKGFLPVGVKRAAPTLKGVSIAVRTGRQRLKIIYTRGNRTETLASISTCGRSWAASSATACSTKSPRATSAVMSSFPRRTPSSSDPSKSSIAITLPLLFSTRTVPRTASRFSIPSALRIYDETLGKGFAVSFLSEPGGDVESRCYLRDEGDESDGVSVKCDLEAITLPQLFEYLDEITNVTRAVGPRVEPPF